MQIEFVDSVKCSMMSNFPSSNGISSTNRNTVMLSTIVQPASYPYIDYVPIYGFDFFAGQNLGIPYSDAGCNSVCSQLTSCLAFTTQNGVCKLKSVISDVIVSSNMTVYFPVKQKRQYGVYNSLEFIQPNLLYFDGKKGECRQVCDALPKCVGYVKLP